MFADTNTTQDILSSWQNTDTAQQIDSVLQTYRKWLGGAVLMMIVGVALFTLAGQNGPMFGIGLFLAITGMTQVALMKLWMHIKLATLRILWDMRQREPAPELQPVE